MVSYREIITNLPEVQKPVQKRLSFKEKFKWTGFILLLFFLLGMIPLYGLGGNALAQFEFLSIILGAEFGSIISLGIGPIVTASILLQLLNGSGLLKFDMQSTDGKVLFQGTQKLLAFAFIVFEAIVYVAMGGLSPAVGINPSIVIFQLILGGILILFMSEVVDKWGFSQGVSLFIAAGVSKGLVIRLLSPISSSGELSYSTGEPPIGALLAIFHFLPLGSINDVLVNVLAILSTCLIFAVAVYAQAMKVEVPLSFGRIRGQGIRWPLAFVYTSNIPVILVAALLANLQLWARLLQNWSPDRAWLGTFDPATGLANSGVIAWLTPPNLVDLTIRGSLVLTDIGQAITYIIFLTAGAVVFSVFWVKTAGMDARSQAKNMMSSGLQIPGFRRDERVLESLLNRYIPALTIMGAITVGVLAAAADVSGALTSGTGLLLTVMIIYRLYEEIAQQHAMDMNPAIRRFIE